MVMKRILWHVLLAPNDGQGGGDGGGGGSGGTKTDPKAGADDAAKLRAAETELATLKRTIADKEKSETDAKKKAADDELISQGKLKQLLENKESELAQLRVDADFGKEARAAHEKKISESLVKLSLPDQEMVKAVPANQREALITRLLAVAGAGAGNNGTNGSSSGSGPPAAGGEIDFAEAWKDPAKWSEAKKKDAKGAEAWLSGVARGNSQPVSFHRPRPKSA